MRKSTMVLDNKAHPRAFVCLLAVIAIFTTTTFAQANQVVPNRPQQQQHHHHWHLNTHHHHHHNGNSAAPQQQQQPQVSQPRAAATNSDLQIGASSMSSSSQAMGNPASLFKDLSGPTSGKIQTLDVICGKNFMTVRAEFSAPFYGIVFSKGTYGQENCIYVKPNSGLTHAAFNVYYDQCGTKPDLQGKFYENTIVIQYGSDIIEAYDEAKRLRCEWFEAYEKPATFKPAIPVADLEVVEMNFQGDDIDCWMEIQEGTGPQSREVSKIVPVGQPMTIVVAINDYNGQFDMRVKSCMAHDGVQQPIALTDEYGCVLRPKMLTSFQKIKNPGGIHKKATILSYARFLAFKFPDSMTVQIQCTVEVCRHGCADACQRIPSIAATTMQPELSLMAKWPAAPNQAALVSPDASQSRPLLSVLGGNRAQEAATVESAAQGARPTRVQFAGLQQPRQPTQPEATATDDMNGSESNHQAAAMAASQPKPHYQQPQAQQHRRSQDEATPTSQPQFVVPNRRPAFSGARLGPPQGMQSAPQQVPSSTPTTTSTAAPTTSAPVPVDRASDRSENQDQNDESGGESAAEQAASDDSSLTRLNASSGGEQAAVAGVENKNGGGEQVASEQSDSPGQSAKEQDNKREASQLKPSFTEASLGSEKQQQSAPGDASDSQAGQPAEGSQAGQQSHNQAESSPTEASSNKPSVQGTDDEPVAPKSEPQGSANQQPQQQAPTQAQSSLKTVEVEIPTNEDPVRAFLAAQSQQQQSAQQPGQQQPSMASYDSIMFENSRIYGNNEQTIIQPRDKQQSGRSEQMDEAAAASQLMLGSGKMRFGARSPQATQQQQQAAADRAAAAHSAAQQEAAAIANHQQDDSASPREQGSHSDKVLNDRSDDSSLITELVNSQTDAIDSSKSQVGGELMVAEESVPVSSISSSSSSSLSAGAGSGSTSMASESANRPVVGTDELATGPIQIEDRMGSEVAASSERASGHSESLEEALNRLQQRIPQTATLVSSQQVNRKSSAAEQPAHHMVSSQQQLAEQQQQSAKSSVSSAADERQDSSNLNTRKDQQQSALQRSPHIGSKLDAPTSSSSSSIDRTQPHPNVVGQAKVIPDPSGSALNTRGSMLAQASGSEGISQAKPVVVPAPANQQQPVYVAKPQQQQQQSMSQIDPSKPVAQITNVPIGLGFSQSQLPAIQQLQQQLAAQFQQQQMKQQQTTAKPSRGRFSLLQGPQAAFQAVASRLLPKSAQVNQQQQPRLPSVAVPQAQQQLLQQQQYLASIPSQQQQHVANQFLNAKQPINFAQVQPTLAPKSVGLFGRLTGSLHPQQQLQQQHPQQQAPLVRKRRSALMPNGQRGSGEVGVAKTFMVVTGMDLAFSPNLNDTELPQILEGRRLADGAKSFVDDDGEIIYGVCMPIVSLTFVLTCAFWLVIFMLSFCLYMLVKSKRAARRNEEQLYVANKLSGMQQ